MSVHPTAIVEDGVELGADVEIGPYAVVRAGTVLGDGVTVGDQAIVGAGAVVNADVPARTVADLDRRLLADATGRSWMRARRPDLYVPLTVPTGLECDTRKLKFEE